MIIRDVKELANVLSQLSSELANNKVFRSRIEYEIYRMIENTHEVEVFISENGNKVRFVAGENIVRNDVIPKNTINALDYEIKSDGTLEKLSTYATLYEANSFYAGRNDRPSFNVSSVLATSYQRSLYDKNGIETSYSDYSKFGWPLTGVHYTDTKEFRTQVFSPNLHMPREWNLYGPYDPNYAMGSSVTGTIRDPKYPGLATVYSYDLEGFNAMPKNRKTFLAEIHGEYPERIRVDEWGKFATFEDGEWKVYDPYDVYGGKTLEEIIIEKVNNYKNVLESSKTHMYDRYDSENYYNILKEMVDESIKRVNDEGSKIK